MANAQWRYLSALNLSQVPMRRYQNMGLSLDVQLVPTGRAEAEQSGKAFEVKM
jgi:hypothetical protein